VALSVISTSGFQLQKERASPLVRKRRESSSAQRFLTLYTSAHDLLPTDRTRQLPPGLRYCLDLLDALEEDGDPKRDFRHHPSDVSLCAPTELEHRQHLGKKDSNIMNKLE
jgi:hypothetical protein